MWSEILGGIIGNATTKPTQVVPPNTTDKAEIAYYIVLVVLVGIVGFLLFKLSK